MSRNSKGAAPRSGSVLDASVDVTILVMGEAAIGKSFMIQAYIGNRIPSPAEVPAVHPVYRMTPQTEPASSQLALRPPSQNTRVIVDSDGIALGASADEIRATIARHKPDVIVLAFSHEDPMSLQRLATHWLPAIKSADPRPSWPYIPVVLAGLRLDEMDEGAVASWLSAHRSTTLALASAYLPEEGNPFAADELLQGLGVGGGGADGDGTASAGLSVTDIRDRTVENLMIAHINVMATISLSAARPTHVSGLLGEIGEVWDRAVDQVLYPVFPLFNTAATELTDGAAVAFSRIFRIMDGDDDGLLGVDEFQLWQTLSFGYRVPDSDVRELFHRIAAEMPDGVTADASCLTEAGFRHVLISYIFGMATDSVWTVLHAFGYRWGVPPSPHGRLSLELGAAAGTFVSGRAGGSRSSSGTEVLAGSPSRVSSSSASASASSAGAASDGGGKRLYLHLPDPYVSLEARTPDGALVLSGTTRFDYRRLSLDNILSRTEAKRTGVGFVCRLFRRFASGGRDGNSLLMPEDVRRIFAVCPSGSHPFGALFPDVTTHSHDGGLSLVAWVNLWQMLLTCKPAAGLATLFHLGYCTPAGGSGGSAASLALSFDPRRAVEDAGPRRTGGDLHPSPVRRVFVVGSAGSGKTSLILHYLNGPGALRDRTAALATFSRDDRPGPSATTAPTHYVSEGVLPEEETPAAKEACPAALVITEWPADTDLAEVMAAAEGQADAVLITVDPALPSSIAYCTRAIDRVPDRVPTVVVATNHERDPAQTAAGKKLLDALCCSAPSVDLITAMLDGAPASAAGGAAGPAVAARKALLAAVAAAQAELEEGVLPSAQYAADCRALAEGRMYASAGSGGSGSSSRSSGDAAAAAVVVPGLCLEVFKFGVRAKGDNTVELFKYATSTALRHGLDNPQTPGRRSRERIAKLLAVVSGMGKAALLLAVLGAVGMYVADVKGTRARVNGALSSMVRRVEGAVGLGGRGGTLSSSSRRAEPRMA